MEQDEKELKKQKASTSLKWILFIVFFIRGITFLPKGAIVSAIACLLIALLFFPPLKAYLDKEVHFLNNTGKKGVLVIVFFFVAIFYSPSFQKYSNEHKKQEITEEADKKEQIEPVVHEEKPVEEKLLVVTAPEIIEYYHANEVSADQHFKNRKIGVVGIVESIQKDFLGSIKVILKGDEMFSNVYCTVKDESAAASLSKGQQIKVKGKCTGMIMQSVTMDDCTIIQ